MSFPPLHPGDAVAADHLAHIIGGLRNRTLPKAEWTHGAHLTAAVALLNETGLDGALAAMPDMIRRYNEATGVNNTDTEGYHHTITVFYLQVIDDFRRSVHKKTPHEQATALLASPSAARDYALQFYSRELLFSVDARRNYCAPDIKPYPGQV